MGGFTFYDKGDVGYLNPSSVINEKIRLYIDLREREYSQDTHKNMIRNIIRLAIDGAHFVGEEAIVGSLIAMRQSANTYIKNNIKRKSSTLGVYRKTKSHKSIPKETLLELFDCLGQRNFKFLNTIILFLTIGNRPTEFERMLLNPDSFLILGKILDLKKLIHKTELDIENPILSLLARVILKNRDRYTLVNSKYEMKKIFDKKTGIRSFETFKELYPRRFRATTGTGLIQCKRAANPLFRADHETVAERFGHVDSGQAIKVYAKRPFDKEATAESFFGLSNLKLKGFDGEITDVSEGFPLWDTWLLKCWLKQIEKNIGTKEFEQAKSLVINEYKIAKSKMKEDEFEEIM